MKKVNRILILLFLSVSTLMAQKEARFTVEVSRDSVLMNNYFKVTFSIENTDANNFEAPDFKHFEIVSGPNVSSQVSMMNGEVTQKVAYTYYLKTVEKGHFVIPTVQLKTKDKVLKTNEIDIVVLDNPNGIMQEAEQEGNPSTDPFSLFRQRFFMEEQPLERPNPPTQEAPAKKKRNYTKM